MFIIYIIEFDAWLHPTNHSTHVSRWVRAFIKSRGCFTGHVRTTQRAESFNNVMAPLAGKTTGLAELFETLLRKAADVEGKEAGELRKRCATPTKQVVGSTKPLELFLRERAGVTECITRRVVAQLLESDRYTMVDKGGAVGAAGQEREFEVSLVAKHQIR